MRGTDAKCPQDKPISEYTCVGNVNAPSYPNGLAWLTFEEPCPQSTQHFDWIFHFKSLLGSVGHEPELDKKIDHDPIFSKSQS